MVIKNIGKTWITTSIPNNHDLKINTKDKETWDYQISRMTIIGDVLKYRHLIEHQKLN